MPQKDKPKVLSTDKPFNRTKNKEKNYVEDQNKEEDNPEKSMREVGKFKRQIDFKTQEPVHLRGKRVAGKAPALKKL